MLAVISTLKESKGPLVRVKHRIGAQFLRAFGYAGQTRVEDEVAWLFGRVEGGTGGPRDANSGVFVVSSACGARGAVAAGGGYSTSIASIASISLISSLS